MQALKALPLMRPSRSSSPAPPVTTPANGDSHPTAWNGPAAGNVLPGVSRSSSGPPRSRSITRPLGTLSLTKEAALTPHHTGPAGVSTPNGVMTPGIAVNGVLHGGKTGTSPPGTRPATPGMAPSASMGNLGSADNGAAVGGVIDGIGLRLNEQVNKTCLGVDSKGRKGFKKGAGWTLGQAVVKELPAPTADAYLLRAVLRTAVKSLTIYTSRLEYFMSPAITDPAFLAPMQLQAVSIIPGHATTVLNPTQMFVLSVRHAAWETCEVLEVALESQTYPRFVAELLRPVMDKLDSIVARVVTPLLANLKKELILSLDLGAADSAVSPLANGYKILPGTASSTTPAALPPSIPSKAASHIPVCMRTFAAKVDGARHAFELICKDCQEDGESWIASVVVAVVWRGIVNCSGKTDFQDSSKIFAPSTAAHGRPPSPESMARALASLAKDGTPGATLAPAASVGGAVVKMASILPSRAVSRPASPPKKAADLPVIPGAQGNAIPPAALILASFEALVTRLVSGLVQKPAEIPPSANDPTVPEHLAREALAEALEAITSMKIVVTALERPPAYMLDILQHLKDDVDMDNDQDEQVVDAAEDVPAVLLYHLLTKKLNKSIHHLADSVGAKGAPSMRSPAQVWGIAEEDYERQVLSAFSVAEERARRVALVHKSELERVAKDLAGLVKSSGHVSDLQRDAVKTWIKTMNLALISRSGVACVLPF